MPIRASNSELWFNCPASMMMEKDKPDKPNGMQYAGLCAHHIAKQALTENRGKLEYDNLLGKKIYIVPTECGLETCWGSSYTGPMDKVIFEFVIDCSMVDGVNKYIRSINEINPKQAANAKILNFVEQPFAFDFMTGKKGDTCTPDQLTYDATGRVVYIHDLKWGYGEVEAKYNKQLLCYASAFLRHWEQIHDEQPLYYHFYIHQPNLNLVKSWECDVDHIHQFTEHALDMADLAQLCILQPEGEAAEQQIKPGPHCQNGHCKARATCKKLAEYVTSAVDVEALPMSHSEFTHELTADRLKWLYERVKLFRGWADQIEQTVVDSFKTGKPLIDGYKLVNKNKGTNVYRDEEAAAKEIKRMRIPLDIAFPRKMLTAPQLLEACKLGDIGSRNAKRLQDNFITKTPPQTIVVNEDDERPAVNATPDDFTDLEEMKAKGNSSPVIDWFSKPEKETKPLDNDPFNFI